MSCSVYARAIIGVKLPRPPFKEIKKRGCKHALPDKSVKFCGKCGAESWIVESQPLFDEMGDCTIGEFWFLEGGDSDDSDYYVGIYPTKTKDCMYVRPGVFGGDLSGLDMALLASQLKALLKPMKLWNDDMQVGLWVFGFVAV